MKIKLNVIICMCDQLRAFEIGCYGNKYIRTPCIDKMAEKGFKFDIGVTNALVCTPARASLISGQYSRTCVGSTNNSFADFTIRERRRIPEITIAEQLKANGYKTALIGKWHLYTDPLKMGFDYALYPKVPHIYQNQTFYKNFNEGMVVDEFSPDYELHKVREYIQANNEDPFFLYYNISLPHIPVLNSIPERCLNQYNRSDIKLRENVWINNEPAFNELWFKIYLNDFQFYNRFFAGASEDKLREYDLPEEFDLFDLTVLYDNLVTYTDLLLGQLMDIIMENGICEDTILVFTSDHGDNLGSHGFFNKEQLTEESIRIPLIINYPGRIRNIGDTSNIASIIDIMPTVLELTVLQTGTEEEVVASVRYTLRNGIPDGGYIFSTSNCIYTGMQLERYELMLNIWKKEGIY